MSRNSIVINGDVNVNRGQLGLTIYDSPVADINLNSTYPTFYSQYVLNPTLDINCTMPTIGAANTQVQPGYGILLVNKSLFKITLLDVPTNPSNFIMRPSSVVALLAQTGTPNVWTVIYESTAGISINSSSGAPVTIASDKNGDVYIDTSTGSIYTFNGGIWTTVGGTGVTTVGPNVAATANSASITGSTLNIANASPTTTGVMYGFTENSGTPSTALGLNAYANNLPGKQIVAIGSRALRSSTNSVGSVAVGVQSLESSLTGQYCVGVGHVSLASFISGQYNVAIGASSLQSLTGGDYNTALGTGSGGNLINGNRCIYLGYNSTASAAGNTDEYVFGSNTIGNGTNSYTFSIAAVPAINNTAVHINTTTGQLTRAVSSLRYKDFYDAGYATINSSLIYQLEPRLYTFKADPLPLPDRAVSLGYIAEDVEVIPGWTDDLGMASMLGYAMIDQDGIPTRMVDYFNYSQLVVPIIMELKKLKQSAVTKLSAQTANIIVSGTDVETSFISAGVGSLTINANTLVVGNVIEIESTGSFSLASLNDVTLNMKLGGTYIASSAATSGLGSTLAGYNMKCTMTVRTIGESGTIIGNFQFNQINGITVNSIFSESTLEVALDTTINNTLDLTVMFSTTDAGNNLTSVTGVAKLS